MPGKSTTAPKTNLYPRITGTMTCKWDVGSKGKVFLHTTDGAISLLGYTIFWQATTRTAQRSPRAFRSGGEGQKRLFPGGGIGRRDVAAWLTEDRVANVASGAPGISAPCRSQAIRSTAGCRSGRRGGEWASSSCSASWKVCSCIQTREKKRRKQWVFFFSSSKPKIFKFKYL